MTDREKVLTQLAEIGMGLDMAGYHNDAQCVRDALALLREQEPVKWLKISPAGIYECSGCGQNVFTSDIEVYRFCHGCGRTVKRDAAD